MNTKIWFLLLAAGALSCAGCADPITKILQDFESCVQTNVEKTSNKLRKDWGPFETATYNEQMLQGLAAVKPRDYVRVDPNTGQLEARGLFRLPLYTYTNDVLPCQPVTKYGNGIRNVGLVDSKIAP